MMAPSPSLWFAGKDCQLPHHSSICRREMCAVADCLSVADGDFGVSPESEARLVPVGRRGGLPICQAAKRFRYIYVSECVTTLSLWRCCLNFYISHHVQVPSSQLHHVAPLSPWRQESHFLQFCHQRLWKSRTLAGGTVLTAGPFRWGVGWSTQRDSKTGHQHKSKATWHDPNLTPA